MDVIFLEYLIILGRNIHVRAHICEVGQEKNEQDIWKWVLPYARPCGCTSVRLGGMNTRTPIRPFKPLYVSKPLASTDVAKIRDHYGIRCKGESDIYSDLYLFVCLFVCFGLFVCLFFGYVCG